MYLSFIAMEFANRDGIEAGVHVKPSSWQLMVLFYHSQSSPYHASFMARNLPTAADLPVVLNIWTIWTLPSPLSVQLVTFTHVEAHSLQNPATVGDEKTSRMLPTGIAIRSLSTA